MRLSHIRPHLTFFIAIAALFATACNDGVAPTTNGTANTVTNTNTNTTAPGNTNINIANTSSGMPTPAGGSATSSIETREPDTYRSDIVFTAQTGGGERVMALPQLTTNFAKRGEDKRFEVRLPNNEQVVYLNKGTSRYIVLPNRRQYAEVTSDAVGFKMPEFMTPGQLVSRLQTQRGYTRVGEEQVGGRTAIRYRYADTRSTGTQAGNVQSESYVLVDQATGLPLRAELSSQTSGNVQGMNNLRVIAEMQNINTDVQPTAFDVPQEFSKISEEQIRGQVNAFAAIAGQIFSGMMQNMNNAQQR